MQTVFVPVLPGRRDAAEPASHVRPARPQVPAAGGAAAAALRVGQPQQLVVRAQVERLTGRSLCAVAEHVTGRTWGRVAGAGGNEQCVGAGRPLLSDISFSMFVSFLSAISTIEPVSITIFSPSVSSCTLLTPNCLTYMYMYVYV